MSTISSGSPASKRRFSGAPARELSRASMTDFDAILASRNERKSSDSRSTESPMPFGKMRKAGQVLGLDLLSISEEEINPFLMNTATLRLNLYAANDRLKSIHDSLNEIAVALNNGLPITVQRRDQLMEHVTNALSREPLSLMSEELARTTSPMSCGSPREGSDGPLTPGSSPRRSGLLRFSKTSARRSVGSERGVCEVHLNPENIRLGKLLGRGGGGSVYMAVADSFSFACKIVNLETLSRQEKDAVMNEVHLAEQFRHQHVVVSFGHDIANRHLYSYIELFEGNLRQFLSKRMTLEQYFSDRQVYAMLIQIANALYYLHTLIPVILHRDIKSENIFYRSASEAASSDSTSSNDDFNSNGVPFLKLGDFGECKPLTKKVKRLSGNAGTIEFMAPEVIAAGASEERIYDEKADIWSFGMVIFELVSLDIPYRTLGLRSYELPDHIAKGMRPLLPKRVQNRNAIEQSDIWRMFCCCTEMDSTKRPTAARIVKKITKLRSALNNNDKMTS